MPKNTTNTEKPGLHPRNRHRERYDLEDLVRAWPALGPFLQTLPHGGTSLDFADPQAVKALNQALLARHYGIAHWDIPAGYLCPPIPGRADYVHHAADLLARCHGCEVPRGPRVRVLDIGVGANGIYPILGHREYGWTFVGTDIDPVALRSAAGIVDANPGLKQAIQVRRQRPPAILRGILRDQEHFDLCVCNPPFFSSAAEARETSARKWRNLGRSSPEAPVRNFGGQGGELWCPGGEGAFLGQMIRESAELGSRVLWFTALVSREATLPGLRRALKQAGAVQVCILPMAQGQKKSRALAWSFQTQAQQEAWARKAWGNLGSAPT